VRGGENEGERGGGKEGVRGGGTESAGGGMGVAILSLRVGCVGLSWFLRPPAAAIHLPGKLHFRAGCEMDGKRVAGVTHIWRGNRLPETTYVADDLARQIQAYTRATYEVHDQFEGRWACTSGNKGGRGIKRQQRPQQQRQ